MIGALTLLAVTAMGGTPTLAAAPARPPVAQETATALDAHRLYGTIESFAGGRLVLRLRTGRLVIVDDRLARSTVLLRRGRPVVVFGAPDATGIVRGKAIWRTFPDSAHWPPDR